MIVTCPACSARYKIQEDKIPGRGAKITCPRCAHQFVFYRESAASEVEKAPDNVGALDFGKFGVTWRVRKGPGKHTYEFHDLNTLRELVQDGQVAQWDQISLDNREWIPLETIPSLDEHFWRTWQQLMSGELRVPVSEDGDDADRDDDDEDDSDAPTTLLGGGSELADEIRRAVADAATPSGPATREVSDEGHLVQDEPESPDAKAAPAVVETPAPPPPVQPPPPPAPPSPPPATASTPPAAGNPTAMIAAGVVLLLLLIGGGLWAAGRVGGAGGDRAPAPRSAPAPGGGQPAPSAPAPNPPGGG